MSLSSLLVPTAQVIAITGTGILAGLIGNASVIAVSILPIASPEIAVQQWKALYNRGKVTGPPFALTCSLCLGFLAYTSRSSDIMWMYTVAAVGVPMIMPYTILHMEPLSNRPLMAMANRAEAGVKGMELGVREAEMGRILGQWAGMNAMRALIILLSGVLGTVATIYSYRK